MSNSLKLCPAHFSKGEIFFLRPPTPPCYGPVQSTWSVGTGVRLNARTENYIFSTAIFSVLVARNNVVKHWRQNQRLTFQYCYITVIFSYVSASNCSLNRLDLQLVFFVDFLMARALLVENCQMRLLERVWDILLVSCTWFNSFSIQLEAHQNN